MAARRGGFCQVAADLVKTHILAKVHNNLLARFPEEICSLLRLRILIAGGNVLVALPARIGELVALEHLTLRGNRLVALPRGVGSLARLSSLWLGNNPELVRPPLDMALAAGYSTEGTRAVVAYFAPGGPGDNDEYAEEAVVGGTLGRSSRRPKWGWKKSQAANGMTMAAIEPGAGVGEYRKKPAA